MNELFWGLTIGLIGKVFLVSGVLIAHDELAHEKKVDNEVLRSFRIERWLTFAGLLFIVTGYILEMLFYGFDTTLLTCSGEECAASAASALFPK
ncbi:MAG: hypothetical protein AAB388_01815 [Patescibacteria group bacterium]